MYWRYNLTGEARTRMIRSRKGRNENWFSINFLEMLGMVMRSFAMRVIRREGRRGWGCRADERGYFFGGPVGEELPGGIGGSDIWRDDDIVEGGGAYRGWCFKGNTLWG